MYENLVKTCFYQTGAHPFDADEELKANIIAYYPIAKSILDALNKVAYHDDTQIVSLSVEKFYSDSPRVEVAISSI